MVGVLFLAVGIMLTALLRFIATVAVGEAGDASSFMVFSLGFGVAVTVIPRVARIFATCLASDFLGLEGLGCGLRTDRVMESDRCITLSDTSLVPP